MIAGWATKKLNRATHSSELELVRFASRRRKRIARMIVTTLSTRENGAYAGIKIESSSAILRADDGYAYLCRKTVRLVKGKPELLVEHSLRNTGSKVIETTQYNHNCFVIDHEVVGPDLDIN